VVEASNRVAAEGLRPKHAGGLRCAGPKNEVVCSLIEELGVPLTGDQRESFGGRALGRLDSAQEVIAAAGGIGIP